VLRVSGAGSLGVSLCVPEVETDPLAMWCRSLVEELVLDTAAVGVEHVEDVGELTYRREAPANAPPPGIRAEEWHPGRAFFAETGAQRDALRAWLKRGDALQAPEPVAPRSPAKAVAVPSYLKALASAPEPLAPPVAAPPPAVTSPKFDPDETLPISASTAGSQTLPFQGTTTPERLREMMPPPSGPAADAGATIGIADAGEARDLVAAIRRVHAITLDEYARIRAALVVATESEAEIWSRAGLPAVEDQERLRKRFFDRFQDEPEVRSQFERKLRDAVRKLRGRE